MTLSALFLAAAIFVPPPSPAPGIVGYWREPTGSVIEILPCGSDICARMAALSPQAPTHFDEKNPDPAARHRLICGLQIGYGFHATDPNHAEGGRLYDPKSGKTYHGTMTAQGDQLHLRGYVGIKAFGKTETWTRTIPSTCAK